MLQWQVKLAAFFATNLSFFIFKRSQWKSSNGNQKSRLNEYVNSSTLYAQNASNVNDDAFKFLLLSWLRAIKMAYPHCVRVGADVKAGLWKRRWKSTRHTFQYFFSWVWQKVEETTEVGIESDRWNKKEKHKTKQKKLNPHEKNVL